MRQNFCQLFIATVIFLCFYVHSNAQTPSASFVSVPAASGGTITVCQGQNVTFINNSSNTTGNSTFTWSFGTGALPANANGIGPHTTAYNTVGSTNATLTVNNNNGNPASTYTIQIQILSSPISNLSITNAGAGYGTSTQGGLTLFKNCNGLDTIAFNFQSSYNNSVNQIFSWGDGSPNENQLNMSGNTIAHNYPLGQFTLTHTVTLANGCTISKNYIVFNGSAPLVTVSGSGQTTCLPSPYSIDILSNDVPINYTVSFSDGSTSSIFTTANDTTIAHLFNSSSCGIDYNYAPGFPPIENAFSATIVAQNACSSNGLPTVITVGPITISTGTNAEFTIDPPSPICINEPVTFTNTSQGGENINSNGCDNSYSFYWNIEETTGYSISNGSLGSSNGFIGNTQDYTQWTNGSDELEITFNVAGTYHIWIHTSNFCGADSIRHEVVINPIGTVLMNPTQQTICSGETSSVFTMTGTVPSYNIYWNVENTQDVSVVTPSSGSGPNPLNSPQFTLFNNTNNIGFVEISATVGCTNEAAVVHTIYVEPQANVFATPSTDNICSNEAINFEISSNLNNVTFNWTASGPNFISGFSNGNGTAINQTLVNNGNVADTVFYHIVPSGIQCPGNDSTVYVIVQPNVTISNNSDLAGCPNFIFDPNNYITSPNGANLSWSNSNTAIGLGANGSGDVPTWTAPQNDTGSPITGTITVTAQINNCPVVTDDFLVTVYPSPSLSTAISPSGGLDCFTGQAVITSTPTPGNSTLQWSGGTIVSGANSTSTVVSEAGIYSVTVTDPTTACESNFNVTINPPTPINIVNSEQSDVTCNGYNNGSILISTDASDEVTYTWNPNISTTEAAANLTPGNYSVTVTNSSGCIDNANFVINEPTPIIISVIDTLRSECGEANGYIVVAAGGGTPGYAFNWINQNNGAVLNGIDAGTYTVVASDQNNCSSQLSVSIGCTPLIPVEPVQFISPNGDNTNENWIIENLELYPNNEVWIFNRWGTLVFHASPYDNSWKGTNDEGNGALLPAATYYYLIDTHKKSQEPFRGFIEVQP
jgi:gliding motility-associated-like protein